MKLVCVDLFCGAGGTSEGLVEAAEQLGLEVELLAINHWPVAIATHSANHPRARHICARIEEVRPRDVVPTGRVHLLVASPECTHHSTATGGRPIDDQRRVPAWGVIHWLQELYVDQVIIENVPEFRSWGPIGANKKPLRSRRGETYQAFLQAIRSLGYNVDERVLCCADYGDATTRKRLFIVATRRGQPTWPQPTHSPDGEASLFSTTEPWRTARSIIDWDLLGKSIFDRKKPLAAKTMRRIAAGMKKFNHIDITPYIEIVLHGNASSRPTPTSCEQHVGPTRPYVVNMKGKSRASNIDAPAPALTTQSHLALVEPILVPDMTPFVVGIDQAGGHGICANSVEEPLSTITTKARHALVAPLVIGAGGRAPVTRQSITLPQPSVIAGEPFVVAAGGPEGKGKTT